MYPYQGVQVGELLAAQSRIAQQRRVIIHPPKVAVVGNPVQGERLVGAGGASRQAQVEVVLRLQKLVRGAVAVGVGILEVQDVPQRVFA